MRTKPGPGWTNLHPPSEESGPVWEHTSGVRIHAAGLVLLPNDEAAFWANLWPESQEIDRAIRMCGGNRKRGMMCYALEKAREL